MSNNTKKVNKFFVFLGIKLSLFLFVSAYLIMNADNHILKGFESKPVDSFSAQKSIMKFKHGTRLVNTISFSIDGETFIARSYPEFLYKWDTVSPLYAVTTGNIFLTKTRICPEQSLVDKECLWINPKNNSKESISRVFLQ